MAEYMGEYKIIRRMDGGGNANVFVAENARGEEVAIKILREESGNGKKAVKRNRKKRIRFKIETEMVVGIQDEIKGVIPIFSYGLPDEKTKKYWYAMPIAIPLEDKLKEVKSLEDKVNCVLELARTLEALHKKDIVHRDIKPKNIYFYNGKYCLGDFGLVDYPEKRDLTSLQEAVGPKATMAPEMRYNAKNADGKKADVYSLAKTLWIVLTGVDHGFEGRYEEDDAIIGLRNDKRYKKEHLVELEELLKQATEYDPSLRPSMESYYMMKDFTKFSSIYQKNPFSIKEEKEDVETHRRIEESCKFDKFIEENWNKWCLKDICDENNNKNDGKLEFAIMFHINGGTFGARKYVAETGYICEEDVIPYPVSKDGKYLFTDFNGAVKAIVEMKDYIKKLCSESGIVWQEMGIYFTIKLFRIKPPSHIFTEEEIKEVLRAGNDFRNNRLVIDEEGYAQLIDSDLHYECYRYPVSQESYDARNNYVGQYANLDDVGEIYLAMLDGWLHHLRTGQRYDVDYYDQCEDAEKMLAEIKQYYQ